MKHPLAFFLLTLPLLVRAGGDPTLPEQAREVVREFSLALKKTLQRHLAAGGPVEAIEACRLKAPALAAGVGERHHWKVGRTSLRTRNPANDPDRWERRVLQEFEARKAAGEEATRLEHYEVITREGRRVFRYMKAIPTTPLCLACHGSELSPRLSARLGELYPQDRARDFSVGDLRGAFTLQRVLDN